jgi:hypothetical protein
MNNFELNGYEYIPNILTKDVCEVLSKQFLMMRDNVMYEYKKHVKDGSYFANDPLITNSYSIYGSLFSDPLLELLKPKIEKIVGKELYPTYSYSRVYYNGGEMEPHLDRPSSEYALTITISIDRKPWEIYLKDFNNIEVCASLDVGCGILYQGTKIPHWREKYNGNEQVQFMLFWVNKNGEFSEMKYDQRPLLGCKKIEKN